MQNGFCHPTGLVTFTCHLPRDKFCEKYFSDPEDGGKRKMSETQNKSDYEIIQEPIILLSDIFLPILALRPKLRVREQRDDPSHPLTNRYGQYMAHK